MCVGVYLCIYNSYNKRKNKTMNLKGCTGVGVGLGVGRWDKESEEENDVNVF